MPASVISRRDRDDLSSVHSYPSQPRHYTTVRRYKYAGTLPDEERENEAMRIVVRDRDGRHESEEEIDIKVTERERTDGRGRGETYRIVRRRSRSKSSSSSSSGSEEEEETKTVRSVRSPYTLEKYSKSTEYFSQPAPQPIVIRERSVRPMIIERDAPQQIIVRQEEPRQQMVRRERPNYELVERQRPRDDRSQYSEEDYYYYRGPVREDEEPRRRRRHRHHRHEAEAAAAGAGALALAGAGRHRRNRRSDRDAYSDDDVVVIRRERSLSSSPDDARHRRHIGEGVVAGLAAAAVTRNRRKSRGENAGGRLGTYVGYGALGGVGAEVLSRINRNRSRSRSRSVEYLGRGRDRRRESGSRSRSRSKSISTKEAVAGVIGLGALAAIAYTAGKRNNKSDNNLVRETTVTEEAPGRGRSRSRSRSLFRRRTSTVSDGALSDPEAPRDSALNPQHRNNTIAKAGLAGAVAAGAYEWNKNRNSRSRSKSRVREGVPIVATGLASAAIAGLYERNKAKREARSQSRPGRSRSAPASRRALEDDSLVSYGDDPIEPDDSRRRSRSRRHHRRDSYSRSPSPDNRHHGRDRSRSRSRNVAEAAAVAAAAGVAAHEAGKRRERRRNQKQRRQEEEAAAANQHSPPYSPSDAPSNYYPSTNSFAPPPTIYQQPYGQQAYQQPAGTNPAYYNHPAQPGADYGNQGPTAYNPAQYGVTRGPTLPQEDVPTEHYGGYNGHEQPGYRDPRYPNGGPENVSTASRAVNEEIGRDPNGVRDHSPPEEPILSRHSSASTEHPQPERAARGVRFSVDEGQAPRSRTSASETRDGGRRNSSDSSSPRQSRSSVAKDRESRSSRPSQYEESRQARERQREQRSRSEPRRRASSPADSEGTIEEPDLADRFDEQGRERRPSRGGSLADHLEGMFRNFRRGS